MEVSSLTLTPIYPCPMLVGCVDAHVGYRGSRRESAPCHVSTRTASFRFRQSQKKIWCINNFEKDQRIIKMNGRSPISLGPPTSNRCLNSRSRLQYLKSRNPRILSKLKMAAEIFYRAVPGGSFNNARGLIFNIG